jgi:pyridoxamine 5'-phosphate oxidase family protein
MIFTEGELSYMATQRLGRLATIQPSGDPQVSPVSCYYNPDTGTIDIGGHNMAASRKYRNVQHNPRAAVVIDDMTPGSPRAYKPSTVPSPEAVTASGATSTNQELTRTAGTGGVPARNHRDAACGCTPCSRADSVRFTTSTLLLEQQFAL